MDKKTLLVVLSTVGLMLISAGLLHAAGEENRTVIRVGGSNSIIQSVENWGKAYAEDNPGVVVVTQGGGTDAGFRKLLDKELDLIFTADVLSEEGKKNAKAKGIELDEHFIAWGGVCVVVHPENPVQSLDVDQVRQMLTGEVKSWKEVGGSDMAVVPFIREEHTPRTKTVFQDRFLRGKPVSPQARMSTSFTRLLKLVEEEKGAVALVGCLALTSIKNPLKTLALKKAPDSPAVKWSAETFKDKSYPIARPLYFYWDKNSPNVVQLMKFADFCKNLIWDGKCHVISDELCRVPADAPLFASGLVFRMARGCCR